MKKSLQALAALVAVGAIAIWLATGAHRGWTMTEVPNTTVDEVTGLTGGPPQKKFVAGVDFLGAALLGAGVLGGISLLFRKSTKLKN
jgi:hypothetical protein